MRSSILFLVVAAISSTTAWGANYRDFSLKLRPQGSFQVPMPGGTNQSFSYQMTLAAPVFATPLTSNFALSPDASTYFVRFWDKIFLADGSAIQFGSTKVPLTCVFIDGQDNTHSGNTSPLIPGYVLKVYLVANDFTCTGPINPAWPSGGVKKEMWDTYLYFEIRDPTIMLPTEIKVRYRWNEFPAVLIDGGGH